MEIRRATEADFAEMTDVWHSAVTHSYDFLTESDIEGFRKQIPTEVFPAVPEIWVATGDDGEITGFVGMEGDEVAMLYIGGDHQRKGIGTALIDLVAEGRPVLEVEVNEQAPQSVAFYSELGFEQISRSPVDAAGKPFPLLRMKRPGVDSV